MIQFFFSPTVSIQLENTTVYVDFCSWLNITTRPQSSFFSLPPTTWYFQRQPWIWKIFKIPHLKHAEQKSHPCYQWGHLNVLAHILTFTEVQFCAANHTHKVRPETNPTQERNPKSREAQPHLRKEMQIKQKKKERKRSWLTFEDKKGADKNQAEDCPHHGDPRDAPLAKESSLFAIRALMLLLHP